MNKPLVVASVLVVAGVVAWYALSKPRAAEVKVEVLAARPRPRAERAQVRRDGELDTLLSEILREPVESRDALEALYDSEPAAPAASNVHSAPEAEAPILEVPPDVTSLVIADREPNLQRVEGLEGPVIQREWPGGALMLEARQRQDEDGVWALDGAWRAWFADGMLEEAGEYRDDLEHGRWTWQWANGAPQAEGEFDRGVRVGCWKFWHPNGVLIGEGCYENGVRSGRWTFRRADGSNVADYSGEYRDGHRAGP